jgi:hypothetical protein
MALGRYPEVALADARVRWDAARKRLANGIDPMAERMAEKTAVKVATEHTFKKIAGLRWEPWGVIRKQPNHRPCPTRPRTIR